MNVPTRIGFQDACRILDEVAAQRCIASGQAAFERVTLAKAHGRVLAQPVVATLPQPGFDNSAMDGFAVRHADLNADGETSLLLVGEQFAGRARELTVGEGEGVRITTGAPLPVGADTIVVKENARVEGDKITVIHASRRGQHVRRTGEDVRIDDALLAAGQMLTPSRVALAAGQGLDRLEVAKRPTIAVFTTGDELVEPGLPLRPGELYNSNRELLMGLLRADGYEPVMWPNLTDTPSAIDAGLRHAGHAFDVVITCGGVSAGEKDHLPALLQAEGHVHFWKVRMKPGMPVLFADGGRLGDALFLCLPGNPVSVLATWLTLGRRLLDGLQGRAEPRPQLRARLSTDWRKTHDRLEFLRGRLWYDDEGRLHVDPNPADGSHRMRAAADSDALIVLGEGEMTLAAGDVVDVLPY